jgi:hypothetical protein
MSDNDGLLTAGNPAADTPAAPAAPANWKDSIPSDLRYSKDGNDKLARFNDELSLAKSYLEMEKMDSGKVKMPDDDSTPEEKSAFYQKLGKPEDVTGYELPDLAEGEAYDEDMMGAIKNYAFENNIPKDMFSGMVGIYMQEAQAAMERQAAATEDTLKGEWAGDYDKNIEISRRALRELVPDDITEPLIAELNRTNMGNSEPFTRFLHAVGSKMLDDTLVKGDPVKPADDGYMPKYASSPEQYRNDESEDGVKARAWFTKNKGFVY